jgi:ArsR family transcriptional regulator
VPKRNHQLLSPEALQLVAARFKVLSDPMRLRILQALEDGEMSVSAITEAVESTQPNVSKHLKILQDAGILVRRQEGNVVYYSIADETVFKLCEVVCSSLQEHFEAHANVLARRAAVVGRRRR